MLLAGRKTEAKFSGSAAESGRLRGSGGGWREGAREERGWGRFGVRGWLHTKEQAAGRRYDARANHRGSPAIKGLARRPWELAGNGSRSHSPGLCSGEKGSENTPPSGTDGRTPPPARPTHPTGVKPLLLGIAVRSPGIWLVSLRSWRTTGLRGGEGLGGRQ